jgi:hypothetical protein
MTIKLTPNQAGKLRDLSEYTGQDPQELLDNWIDELHKSLTEVKEEE